MGFGGTLGGCMGYPLVEFVFFVYFVINQIVDRAPRRHFYTKTRLR